MTQVDADKINLKYVKTLKSNIEIGTSFNRDKKPKYSLSFAQDSGVNIEDKNIILNLNILVKAEGKNDYNSATGEFKIQFLFNIENLNELTEIGKDRIPLISGELSATIVGIAYSTARGIILSATEQSVMGGILLPVINPVNLLKQEQAQP